jgi:CBS domain-containing protein
MKSVPHAGGFAAKALEQRHRSIEVPSLLREARDFIDLSPHCLPPETSLEAAASLLAEHGLWGAPVVGRHDAYLGTCTVKSILACALPIAPETVPSGSGLGYLRENVARVRERLRGAIRRRVDDLIDLDVPMVRESTSLPQLLFVLGRRAPMVPIVTDTGGRLVGVVHWERVLRALWPA